MQLTAVPTVLHAGEAFNALLGLGAGNGKSAANRAFNTFRNSTNYKFQVRGVPAKTVTMKEQAPPFAEMMARARAAK